MRLSNKERLIRASTGTNHDLTDYIPGPDMVTGNWRWDGSETRSAALLGYNENGLDLPALIALKRRRIDASEIPRFATTNFSGPAW
jgi:hypothetical protein